MPRRTRLATPAPRVGQILSLPAPTGGLNARDSLALMQMNEAVTLTNLFPLRYGVRVRKGWRRHATGLTGNVESLITHATNTGAQTMFAAANGHFYDVTTAGAVGAAVAPSVGAFSNNRWQFAALSNTFGNFTVAVNGADTPQKYDGTGWLNASITADAGLYPTFSANNLIGVKLAHRRLWFIEANSGSAWYLPVDQISGNVARFHVGEVFPRGGYLQAIGTWSVDSGAGVDDYTVFVGSEGDIAVYSGFDPTDATNWVLVGVYETGPTLGRRCTINRGGDLLILSESGLTPMSTVMAQSQNGQLALPISDKIQQKLSTDVASYGADFGWQLTSVKRHQMLLVNVPTLLKQYAMNLVTGAWCEFEGYAGYCWAVLNGEPYFGSAGFVGQAWYGDTDDYDAGSFTGNTIAATALQAFNYFGAQALQKRWTMVRPTFNSVTVPPLRVSLSVDFDLEDHLTPPSLVASTAVVATFDLSTWDSGVWNGALQSVKNWYSLGQLGYAGALAMKLATKDETTWIATDFVYEPGGVL